MTFGGSPCPSLWGFILDTLIDIANILIHNKDWDHTTLFDPISTTIDEPQSLPESISFAQATDLYYKPPLNNIGI